MPDLPSSRATLATAGANSAAAPLAESLIDRERRSPWLRWFVHLGAPVGVSMFVHLVLLILLGITGWVVMSKPRPAADIGEYEAGITNSLPDNLAAALTSSDRENLETPEPDVVQFDRLNQWAGASLDIDDKSPEGLGDAPSGMGLGASGRGDVLGIGDGAGGDGRGAGVGSGQRGAWATIIRKELHANKIAFVVDFSGSVIVAQEDLVRQLKRSIGRLRPTQSFNVTIFFSTGAERGSTVVTDSFRQSLQAANSSTKQAFYDWIATKSPQGSTEPLEALKRALKLEPDAIAFFSDGYFDESVVEQVRVANKRKTRISCFVIDDILLQQNNPDLAARLTDGAKRLQRMAAENDGEFMIVTMADLLSK